MSDEPTVEIRGDGLEDIWINGHPVGKLLDSANRRISELEGELEALRADEKGISPEVRNRLLEIHQDWIDIREGRLARFDSAANARRAARLFRRFIQRCGGASQAETGVTVSRSRFIMPRDEARRIIGREDDLPVSGESTTIKRTFREAVRRSRDVSCGCEWQECDHALLQFRKTDTYQLTADEQRLDDYLHSVAELVEEIEAEESTTADDGRDRPEDAVDQQLAELETADAVVSSSTTRPSAATNGHSQKE